MQKHKRPQFDTAWPFFQMITSFQNKVFYQVRVADHRWEWPAGFCAEIDPIDKENQVPSERGGREEISGKPPQMPAAADRLPCFPSWPRYSEIRNRCQRWQFRYGFG